MPIIKIDLIKGKSKDYIKEVLDISYEVMLEAFHAPVGDRYQIVTQHEAYEMQILDTGLGVERTTDVLVFTLITRPRTQEQKRFLSQASRNVTSKIRHSKRRRTHYSCRKHR